MRKRLAILAMVALIVLVTATPALARRGGPGQGGRQGGRLFALVGTITAIGNNNTITVDVVSGNRLVKDHIGERLTVQVTENTSYMRWAPDGSVPITFDDVEVDDSTSIRGTVSNGAFIARQVTVDVPLTHYPAASASAGNGPPPGGPPGWSHENPGQGGSENPGPGGS